MTIALNRTETVWGWRYLLFQLLFLPHLLSLAVSLTGLQLRPALLNFLYFSINFLVVILLLGRFLLANLAQTKPVKLLLTAAVALAGYWIASFGVSHLIALIYPDFFNVNDQSIAGMAGSDLPLTAIGTVVLVPITEECLYRGVFFGSLFRRSKVLAYCLSVFVFALIHVLNYFGVYPVDLLCLCLLQYIPAGIFLAWAYEKSDSILCPILMHTVINAIGIFSMR